VVHFQQFIDHRLDNGLGKVQAVLQHVGGDLLLLDSRDPKTVPGDLKKQAHGVGHHAVNVEGQAVWFNFGHRAIGP